MLAGAVLGQRAGRAALRRSRPAARPRRTAGRGCSAGPSSVSPAPARMRRTPVEVERLAGVAGAGQREQLAVEVEAGAQHRERLDRLVRRPREDRAGRRRRPPAATPPAVDGDHAAVVDRLHETGAHDVGRGRGRRTGTSERGGHGESLEPVRERRTAGRPEGRPAVRTRRRGALTPQRRARWSVADLGGGGLGGLGRGRRPSCGRWWPWPWWRAWWRRRACGPWCSCAWRGCGWRRPTCARPWRWWPPPPAPTRRRSRPRRPPRGDRWSRVARAARWVSAAALRAVVTAPLPRRTVVPAWARRSWVDFWLRSRLTSFSPRSARSS